MCRKVIGIDSSHLKKPHGGVLLIVMGIDGNIFMYSIAYAVLEGETKRSDMVLAIFTTRFGNL